MTTPDQYSAEAGCGQRLRKAREAANLTVDDVATRLRMPVRVVESLEAEDWSRLGAPVFIRGQLRSYGRLLGLATAPLHVASGVAPIQPAKLQPRTYTPPMQRVAELFAKRAVYIVITAALAIPVWVATRTHFAVPLQSSSTIDPTATVARVAAKNAPASAARRNPVVASMTPVKRTTAAADGLSLHFKDDSWVRLTAVDGRLLEEVVLAAGDVREFRLGEVGEIVIGNAGAVEIRQQGRVLDLTPFQRANVARFTVSSDGSLQAVAQ
jgi:cytoskeleton protein RodZ